MAANLNIPAQAPNSSTVAGGGAAFSASTKAKLIAGIGAAAAIAVISAAVMWGRTPDYKVLYANISDKDGGAILAQLSQMNIPYKHADSGAAILVPADQVHEARLKLASQGLPKGGTVGFELLENQKFGATQFQEQINFQRGLEGELSKSIQSISSVQSARVHLALTKPSAFLREQQKSSASVVLTLYPGRPLDRSQVAGIVHLVASSVPGMQPMSVAVLDQHGALLSTNSDSAASGVMDAERLQFVSQMEQSYARRIIDLLEPIVGRNNVRAQINAELDFSAVESTAETFKPNVGEASVRSSTLNENSNSSGGTQGGVPGTLSNQPPANPTAPIQGAAGATGATNTAKADSNSKREQITNYEVDKTIRHEKRPVGTLKRLSTAVVINHKKSVDASGKATWAALPTEDIEKMTALAREAIGFTQARGDSINVVNVPFNIEEAQPEQETPLWKQPENISMAKEFGKGLLFVLAFLVLIFSVIRPALKAMGKNSATIPAIGQDGLSLPGSDAIYSPAAQLAPPGNSSLDQIRQLAKQEPATVANVVKTWINKNG